MAFQYYHNTPAPGYIAWKDLNIQYQGQSYAIQDGYTDAKYVFWLYNGNRNVLYASNEFPDLTNDDLLVFYNRNGIAVVVPTSTVVDGGLIVPGTILTDALAANAVTSEKIAAGAITARELAANSVTAGAIAAGAIGASAIAADAIGAEHIAAAAILSEHIAANQVKADHIDTGAIDTRHLKAGIIETSHIRVGDPLEQSAKIVSVGGLPIALPQGGHLFHFDNTFQSTRGLRPLDGYVATLRRTEGRFGGAVAVEASTTNALYGRYVSWLNDLAVGASTERSVGGGTVKITRLGTHRFRAEVVSALSGTAVLSLTSSISWPANQTHVISAYILDYYEAPGTTHAWGLGRSSSGNASLHGRNGTGWKYASVSSTSNVNAAMSLRTGNSSAVVAVGTYIEWEFMQAELNRPFATSFAFGDRPAGKLAYPGNVLSLDEATLICWVKAHPGSPDVRRDIWATNSGVSGVDRIVLGRNVTGNGWGFHFRLAGGTQREIRHNVPLDNEWHMLGFSYKYDASANRYDLALIFDGQIVATSTSASAGKLTRFDTLYSDADQYPANALIDELIVLPYAASADEVRAWYDLRAPFYDAAQQLGLDMTAGHVIQIDHTGIKMTPAGFPQRGMHLNGQMIGFWDINNVPSIGIGDVRQMAQQLGSTMEYGLLLNQGEIRASQSVLRNSLTDESVTRDVLADESVTANKIPNRTITSGKLALGAVGIGQLNEWMQVPDTGRPTLRRYFSENVVTINGNGFNDWKLHDSTMIPKRDNDNGYLMELCRVQLESSSGFIRVLVDGEPIALWDNISGGWALFTVTIDFRPYGDGDHTFEWQLAHARGTPTQSRNRAILQNEQLPIRYGRPQYSITEGQTSGCYSNCQLTCQETCESTCEGSCELSCEEQCQETCQYICEAICMVTCEESSQGGGGCLREGTPVTIWDADTQEYREIPVENLQRGMILPSYNPETDTVEHGELVELIDAKHSNRFIRIHTDVGPYIDVTYSQPFDVMADLGEGWKWYKLTARFLKPGMKMVRPFDKPENMIATITQIEERRERKVHFWNPKTTNGRYTAAGYADQIVKV